MSDSGGVIEFVKEHKWILSLSVPGVISATLIMQLGWPGLVAGVLLAFGIGMFAAVLDGANSEMPEVRPRPESPGHRLAHYHSTHCLHDQCKVNCEWCEERCHFRCNLK